MKNLKIISLWAALLLITSCSKDDSPTVDTQKPSTPLNLIASNITETSMQLNWDAATDNVGVTGYQVFVNGSLTLDEVTTTSVNLDNLTSDTVYQIYLISYDAEGNTSETSNTLETCTLIQTITFKTKLSDMGIYAHTLSDLTPATGVQMYELNTILYTDYAKKQRLIKIPNCQKIAYNGNDLFPNFPNNTMISKTFYYDLDENNPDAGKIIIETRVIIKVNEEWNLGNYVWNNAQTEAYLTTTESVVPIDYVNSQGITTHIDYEIPNMDQCIQCHHNEEIILPIGPKLRNMNFVPSFTNNQNQLDYFIENGFLDGVSSSSEIGVLPNWEDTSLTLAERARAYLDVNCAHCHQPGGETPIFLNTDYRYEVPLDESGIVEGAEEIKSRFESDVFGFGMPLIGRTIVHQEAKELLFEYLDSL
ncbi:MAG: fibronectin type III domain-containing protein [Flavobacteriales bacterium]